MNDLIKYEPMRRYCITKDVRTITFMAPITEAEALALDEDKPRAKQIMEHMLTKFNTKQLIGDACDLDNIPLDIQNKINQYFGADAIVTMPARFNHETLIGDNYKFTEACSVMERYKFGLARIGNPEHVVIYQVFRNGKSA